MDLIAKCFKFADFELDGPKRLLRKHGETVTLTSKSFDLLSVLLDRHSEVVSKDELLEAVWPGQFVEEGNLTVHISTLRKVLGEGKNEHRFIVTVPGRGYSFVAAVDDLSNSEVVVETHTYSNVIVEEHEETDGLMPSHHVAKTIDGVRQNKKLLLAALSVLIVVVAGSVYWFFARGAPTSAQIKSVAVMPFVNDSGNADLEYLSDGLTESLIGSLSRLPELSVKARTSVARYKGKEVNLRKVGSDLGVETLLTGRMVQRGEEVVLYVEFVEH